MAIDFISEARVQESAAGIRLGSVPAAGVAAHALANAAALTTASPIGDLRQFRISKRESQEKFWGRFGVTQSSGSRFETGLSIPAPVAILLKLYANGKLSDGDLQG
ncbi:MAG: transcriptional regulator [Massilia sp.]